MQDYKIIDITREEIVPTAERMRAAGVPLAMIHGHVDDDGRFVVSYEFEVGSGIESYRIAGENSLPSIGKIYDASAEWPEREITELMDIEAVNLIYAAGVPKEPSGPNTMMNTVLSAGAGVILTLAVLVLVYVLDDTIRSEEDVERYLGLSVMGVIPNTAELGSINRNKSGSKVSKKISGNTGKRK